MDLVARMPAYDSSRGSIGAFAGVVFQHRATRIAIRVRRERRMFGEEPLSLDEPLPSGEGTRGDLIPESDGYGPWLGQHRDHLEHAELRLSLASGVGTLDGDDRRLCAALTSATIDELAEWGLGARSTLYRQLARIRLHLLCRGVGPAASAGGA
jgi:RNA polymerase sigma-70 factor (ECF subfamily)